MKKENKAKAFISRALKGRSQPSAPRAGVGKSRYDDGGKVTRKKNV